MIYGFKYFGLNFLALKMQVPYMLYRQAVLDNGIYFHSINTWKVFFYFS